MEIVKYRILDSDVAKLTLDGFLKLIENSVKSAKKTVIAYQNLHGLFLTYKNNRLEKFFRGDVVTIIDGMPLILMGKLLGHKLSKANRLAWIDFMDPLFSLAEENQWSIFYLGTTDETNRSAESKIREVYNIDIECHSGFFDAKVNSADNERIVDQINKAKPNLLIVGMGMPRQEFWIEDNRDKLDVPVIMTCGAALEFFGGVVKAPPRWLGNLGLEWLYRLFGNPGKLWYRYLVEPWYLLFLILKRSLR